MPAPRATRAIGERVSQRTNDHLCCALRSECALTGSASKCSQSPAVACHNTPGSYYCAFGSECPQPSSCPLCPPGYESTNAGQTCSDVNECATNNGGCFPGATCANDVGAFHCSACPQGMTGDGRVCANVNECATDNGGCDAGVRCTDLTPNAANSWLQRVCGDCPGGYTAAGACAVLGTSHHFPRAMGVPFGF